MIKVRFELGTAQTPLPFRHLPSSEGRKTKKKTFYEDWNRHTLPERRKKNWSGRIYHQFIGESF